MSEDENYLEDQLLDEQYKLIQLQKEQHKKEQQQLITKYVILTQSNHLELKHLNQYQILDSQHLREQFNMQIDQILIYNQPQRYQLIEQQIFDKNKLNNYHKFEKSLMIKKNDIIKQIKNSKNSQTKIMIQKLEQINLQKEEICQNIILFLEKKNFKLSLHNLIK